MRLGFEIPCNIFGPDLFITHYGPIVNGAARIGANCWIHTCVNIGTKAHTFLAPKIGDDVCNISVAGFPPRKINEKGSEGLMPA